jgi:hypothetical protein
VSLPSAPQNYTGQTQLTAVQRRIIEELRDLGAEELVQVYLGALRILSQPDFPAAVYFIGHACREIWAALPRYIDAPWPRLDYRKRLDMIVPLWKKVRPAVGAEDALVELSCELYHELDGLFREHESALGVRRRQRVTDMFQTLTREEGPGGAIPPDADVEHWVGLGDRLHGLAHLRARAAGAPELDRARRALSTLELVLWRRLVQPPFYEGVEALDEILHEANR